MRMNLAKHLFAALMCVVFTAEVHAQSSAFTYQGQLTENGSAANGFFDIFTELWDAPSGGSPVGTAITNTAVPVTNGVLTVTLDFGPGVFDGSDRWLELGVRTSGLGVFNTLIPRQPITATPYAIRASNVSSNALANYGGAVSLTNPANSFAGTFSGDGSSLSNVNVSTLGGLSVSNFWQLGGNAGTTAGTQFLGTTDDEPLEVKVGGNRALRIEPAFGDRPNLIGGHFENAVGVQTVGAVVAGGGSTGMPNVIGEDSDFSAVGGGIGNSIGSGAFYSVIPGGRLNAVGAGANWAFAAGNRAKVNHTGTFVWSDSQSADFASTDTDQFLVRASGGVGIGTASPEGDVHIRGNSATGSLIVTPNTANSQAQVLLCENTTASFGMIMRYAGGDADNPLHFIGWNGDTEGSPLLTIERTGGGNVGIGISNPSQKLEVAGNIRANGILGMGSALIVGTEDNQPLQLKVNNEVGFRLEYPTVGSAVNVVGGSSGNTVAGGTEGAVISGGGVVNFGNSIGPGADFAAIGGGVENTLGSNTLCSTIGGGLRNAIQTNSGTSTIAGGQLNTIQANSILSTIGGGNQNMIRTNSGASTIAGGQFNTIQANSSLSTIGGGSANTILDNAAFATVPGGRSNTAEQYAFAAGRRAKAVHPGSFVWADSTDADFASTATNQFNVRAGGGVRFETSGAGVTIDGSAPALRAGGNDFAGTQTVTSGSVGIGTTSPVADLQVNGKIVVHGGFTPTSGTTSNLINIASGNNSDGRRNGISFYETESTPAMSLGYDGTISGTANNAIRIYDNTGAPTINFELGGNIGLGVLNPANPIEHYSGALLTAAGVWQSVSDRAAKEDIEPISPMEVLEKVASLSVTHWKYKVEADGVKHLGPMAQDFHAAFGLGESKTSIGTVDADGVALAAIQGLNQKLEETRAENAELRQELQEIKQLLSSLTKKGNQP